MRGGKDPPWRSEWLQSRPGGGDEVGNSTPTRNGIPVVQLISTRSTDNFLNSLLPQVNCQIRNEMHLSTTLFLPISFNKPCSKKSTLHTIRKLGIRFGLLC